MLNQVIYEFLGGVTTTPEKGSVEMPPETAGRTDIEIGEIVIKVVENSREEDITVRAAKGNGIKEIPPVKGLENTGKQENRDDGR